MMQPLNLQSEDHWYPISYALRLTISRCTSCNAVHQSSALWQVHASYRTPTARKEVPMAADAPLTFKLPVVQLTREALQPICHECVNDLSELGVIPTIERPTDERSWVEAITALARREAELKRTAGLRREAEAKRAATARPGSARDLL